jgi:hypothetical protein
MNSNREFKSKWLQFCAFLHATRSLRYLRTELGPDGLAYFIFADPTDDAPGLEFQFSQGATVSAITLFGSLTFLRRAIKAAQNTLGESRHVSSPRSR